MVYIVGIGPGNPKYIIPQAIETMENCDVILGFERAIESIGSLNTPKVVIKGLKEVIDYIICNESKDISIIASGDPCFYGITNYIKSNFKGEIEVIPGISSFQYLMSKLQKPWQNAFLGSMHGREEDFVSKVLEYEVSVWLTDKNNSPNSLCNRLCENGVNADVYVGEELSYDNEKITIGNVLEIKDKEFSELCVVVVEKNLS